METVGMSSDFIALQVLIQKRVVSTRYARCNSQILAKLPVSKTKLGSQTRKLKQNSKTQTKWFIAREIEVRIQSCAGWKKVKPNRSKNEQNSVARSWTPRA